MDDRVDVKAEPTEAERQISATIAPLLRSFDTLEDEVRHARDELVQKARALLTSLSSSEQELNDIRAQLHAVYDSIKAI